MHTFTLLLLLTFFVASLVPRWTVCSEFLDVFRATQQWFELEALQPQDEEVLAKIHSTNFRGALLVPVSFWNILGTVSLPFLRASHAGIELRIPSMC